MTSKRRIPFLRVGRRVLFDPEQLERWLADRQVGVA
jgi:excisionase family DNA binding protein